MRHSVESARTRMSNRFSADSRSQIASLGPPGYFEIHKNAEALFDAKTVFATGSRFARHTISTGTLP